MRYRQHTQLLRSITARESFSQVPQAERVLTSEILGQEPALSKESGLKGPGFGPPPEG